MMNVDLLKPFFDVVLSEDIGSYQGDTLLVLKNRSDYGWRYYDRSDYIWGFLYSGYGSCSGCDAWEGAETGKQRFQLLAEEVENIKWFNSLNDLQAYVSDKYARELEWYAHESEYKNFVDAVRAIKDTEGETDG